MSDTEFLLNIIFVETIASAVLIVIAIIIGLFIFGVVMHVLHIM